MLKIFVLLLTFISAGLFLTQILPLITQRITIFQKKKFDKTAEQLDKMFVDIEREKFFPMFAVSPIVLGILGLVLFNNFIAGFLGLVLGIILPSLAVQILEKRRRRKFQHQLIDALLIMSSSLKSGLSLLQTIEVVIEEMPPPISQEFKLVLNATKLGIPLERAIDMLNKRMYSEELGMVVTSILVSRDTGGNLSKIFSRVVYTIRQKTKISQQVNNLTLQARWQGMIMMFLPIIFGIGAYRMSPDFFTQMLSSQTGRALLLYALFSQAIGMFMIRRLSKVEV